VLSCEVVAPGAGLPSRLWYRFPSETAPLIEPSGSAFVPTLLLVAMRLRRALHIEGEVSPELLRSLPRLMTIYADWSEEFGPLWRVNVTAASTASPPRGDRAAAFFSCGLDSTFTLLRNVQRYPSEDARSLSHLFIVHGFDVPLADAAFFGQIFDRARRVADAFGKQLVRVATNAREGGFRCVDFQHLILSTLRVCMVAERGLYNCAECSKCLRVAPLAGVLAPLGVTSDRLRHVKRLLARFRPQALPRSGR
jgi:hypothetical protein